jgi:hypothetical protein
MPTIHQYNNNNNNNNNNNTTMFYSKLTLSLAVIGLSFLGCKTPQKANYHIPQNGQTLVWEEHFNDAINPVTWTYDIGDGCAKGICGWGNSEMEYYTNRPQNARVENGNLIIEAHREAFQGKSFTSARLKTEGLMHFK